MIRLLVMLTIGYTAWLVALWTFQERLIFPGMMIRRDGDSVARPREAAVTWIERGPTRVEAWLLPGDGCSAEHPGPLVVYAHGNAELIDDMAYMLARYQRLGVSVLMVEYPGFARSSGTPTEAGITEDFLAALDWAVHDERVDGQRLLFHGRSIGGGVIAQVAARRPPNAMILESTFVELSAFCARYLAPAALLRHHFRTNEVVKNFGRPLLLMHGDRDTTIPVDHARKLHALAPQSRLVTFPAGHNDFPIDSDDYWAEIEGFLRENAFIAAQP